MSLVVIPSDTSCRLSYSSRHSIGVATYIDPVNTRDTGEARFDLILRKPLDKDRSCRRIQRIGHEQIRIPCRPGGSSPVSDNLTRRAGWVCLAYDRGCLETGGIDIGVFVQFQCHISPTVSGSGVDLLDSLDTCQHRFQPRSDLHLDYTCRVAGHIIADGQPGQCA